MAESPIQVPDGLVILLEAFSRTVMEKKPRDLQLFALYYFAKLKEFKKGHSNFKLWRLVKEFHKGTVETLPPFGFEEELHRMGYLTSVPVKSDQTADSVQIPNDGVGYLTSVPVKSDQTADSVKIPSDAEIIFIPVKAFLFQENGSQSRFDNGAVLSASLQPVSPQSLSKAVSCTGTKPKTNNAPQLPLGTDTTKASICMKKSGVTTAVGEPLARRDAVTTLITEERIQNEASTASVSQMSMGVTVVKKKKTSKLRNVERAQLTEAKPTPPKVITVTEVSACSVQCQTSVVSPTYQQPTTGVAGSQFTQDLPSSKATQVIYNTSLKVGREDPAVSPQPESAQTECEVQPRNTREQIRAPSMVSNGHPLAQYPYWNPSFFNRSVYSPYDQPFYSYCPYHQEHAYYSPSLYRYGGTAQESEQSPEKERRCYDSRGSFSAMPFYLPFPMQACRHHPPTVPPSMYPLYRYMPQFAFIGQQPPPAVSPAVSSTQHIQTPVFPGVPMPGDEMGNADWTATRQHPHSTQFNSGDSQKPYCGNPNTCWSNL